MTGTKKEVLLSFVDAVHTAEHLAVMHGMKITQTFHGSDGVAALTAIALLKDGKIVTNRGKVNIQGAGDVGVVPGPGGIDMVEGMVLRPVRFAYVSIMNPARSLPWLERAWENMKKMFIVHVTPYPNETTEFANVVLPSPLLIEREGTVTTGERRVRRVISVIPPPRNTKQDWSIIKDLAKLFGIEWEYKSWVDVFREIVYKIPDYEHISIEKILKGEDQFARKEIRWKHFRPIKGRIVDYPGYPYRLVTARSYYQFNTGDVTMNIGLLREHVNEYFLMNPKDHQSLGSPKEITLISPVSRLKVRVMPDDRVPPKTIIGKFYYGDIPVNVLTPPDTDLETNIPPYKAIPVRVVPVTETSK